jgi:hypothetical protein
MTTSSSGSDRAARTFHVQTRFQEMARRPGGISRARALENAQTEIKQSTPRFDLWLDQELDALTELVRKAEAGPLDPQWTEKMSHHSRQLRDVGTTLGFPLLTFIAGNLCDLLETMQPDAGSNLETIVCHVDSLLLSRRREYRELRPEQVPELSKGLRLVADCATIAPEE